MRDLACSPGRRSFLSHFHSSSRRLGSPAECQHPRKYRANGAVLFDPWRLRARRIDVISCEISKVPQVAAVPWWRIALWSLVVLAASLVRFAALEPQFLLSYRTEQPFATFIGTLLIGQTLGAALFYSATIFLLGLALFFLVRGYGSDRLPVVAAFPALTIETPFW